ncbi:hypothetical protein AAVH_05451 [Aphelenchoides avenae]|nr:hypothetical protein AAVH_05451 [Aphelenchus avenae]
MGDEYEPIGGGDGAIPPPPPPPLPAAPIPQPEPSDGNAPEASQDKPSDYKSAANDQKSREKTDLGSHMNNEAPNADDDKSKDPVKPNAGGMKKDRSKPIGEPLVVHVRKRPGPRFGVSMCCQRTCIIIATVLLALFAVLFVLATSLPYGTNCFTLCAFIFVPPET